MTAATLEPVDVRRMLVAVGDDLQGPGAKLLVNPDALRVVWANRAATELFGTRDPSRLTRAVFGRPAEGRPLVTRLNRLAPNCGLHLERLAITTRFQRFGVTLTCVAIPNQRPKIVLLRGLPARSDALAPALPEASGASVRVPAIGVPDEFQASIFAADLAPSTELVDRQAPAGEHQRGAGPVRFVWRTDEAGTLTHVGPEMASALGASALEVGDTLEARLRPIASEAADALAQALVANGSWTSAAIAWPVEGTAEAATVILGGAPSPGGRGHRGYGVIQKRPELQPSAEAVAPLQADQSPVLDPPVQVLSDPEDQGSSDPATLVPGLDEPVQPLSVDALAEDRADPPDGTQRTAPAQPESETDRSTEVAAHQGRASDLDANPRPLAFDPGVTSVSNVTHLSGTVGASTSKVIHLSNFKPGAPVLSSRMTPRRDPPRVVAPEPVPDALDAPRWSEAPNDEPKSAAAQRLSSHERFNFDEIARALAALPGADAAGIARTAPPREPADVGAAPSGLDGSANSPSRRLDGSAAGDAWAVIETLPTGLLVAQADDVVYANRALLDLLGCSSVEDLRGSGGVGRLFQDLGDLRRPGAAGPRPVAVTTRGDRSIEVSARVQKIVWRGMPAILISVRRPEDEEARARLAATGLDLHKSRTLAGDLAQALDLAASGAGFLDANGSILWLNSGAERLFGYDQREVVGEGSGTLIALEEQPAWEAFFHGFASDAGKGRISAFRKFSGRGRRGASVPIAVSLRRLDDGRICIVWQESTHGHATESELEVLRRDAERASALKSDFLAKVSHEIRTPLNAILGFTEIIVEERFGPIGNERYREYLKDIHVSGTHVVSLINDLLDLSRIEAGGLDIDLVPVDVNAVLSECVATLQGQAHRDRVIIRTSLAARGPVALADQRALRQIVLNLLSNAVKFNEPGGQVIVSTALSETGQVVVRVRDTGPGMSESDIETAMKPFRQLATPKASAGSGLGLPLTKAMVEASQGQFRITSKPGEGTLVEVTLQRAPEPALSLPAE